ncbi:rCG50952 [Rattus norvegicus]|uniref:RCG50952 n=1 Tax=Rattus norvegicus TaxID=10116 RepID=A6KGD3_RAT|nr:rCG50952 [Rattus norvegicus]
MSSWLLPACWGTKEREQHLF